jgi:hypothetical protein
MMKLDRHEADSTRTYLGYPHAPLFRCADVLYRPPLIFSPVRMRSPENLRTQHPFERREHRRPRPKREVNHRLDVSIVKWPNLRLYRCHLSTLTETAPSHPTYSPQYISHRYHSHTSQSLCIGLQLGMADHHFDHQERPDDRRTPELVYKGSSDLARAQSTLRLSCKS